MLNLIRGLDVDRTNMVRFYEEFQHMEKTCLVFERLDLSLFDLILQRDCQPLPLYEIRPVAKQVCSCDQCIMKQILFSSIES